MTGPRAGRILVPLLLAAWCLTATSAHAQESVTARACVKCHVKPAEAITDQRIFVFNRDRWEAGVHARLECTECHRGADAQAFDEIPHRLGAPPPECESCHPNRFRRTVSLPL